MPKVKYDTIYADIKRKIEAKEFDFQTFLPSENALVTKYNCSRNTIRRAMAELTKEGYVQAIQGKGVVNIYQPAEQPTFQTGRIKSFHESACSNHRSPSTKVIKFGYIVSSAKIEKLTGFPAGSKLIYIERLHYLDGKPLIIDHSYFLRDLMPELSVEIAEKSIYEYIENTLCMNIVTSKRMITVERMNDDDRKYINMKDYNCLAVISSQTYNSDGVMFEYTQSRHRPDHFRFSDIAVRK